MVFQCTMALTTRLRPESEFLALEKSVADFTAFVGNTSQRLHRYSLYS
ncbi:hypothetical protein N184_33440 [Sinorhizobium sp. GL28]|nr:hypothetical protein N184_33440 [Sinorhizobium sp. GL28]